MELFEALVDFVDRIVDLLAGVGGHECDTDESVFGGDSGSDDRGDEDARFEEKVGEEEGLVVVADKERDDGGFGVADFEAELAERVEGVVSDVPEGLTTFGFGTHDVESGEDRGSRGGGD